MSQIVIHKIDIGKVKTSKNVMKLLKLLLPVIVKHPVHNVILLMELKMAPFDAKLAGIAR